MKSREDTGRAGVSAETTREFRAWWLILPVVAVSVALIIGAALRVEADPSPTMVAVVCGIGLLAVIAVVATVAEAKRLGHRFG